MLNSTNLSFWIILEFEMFNSECINSRCFKTFTFKIRWINKYPFLVRNFWNHGLKIKKEKIVDDLVNYYNSLIAGCCHFRKMHLWERLPSWCREYQGPNYLQVLSVSHTCGSPPFDSWWLCCTTSWAQTLVNWWECMCSRPLSCNTLI